MGPPTPGERSRGEERDAVVADVQCDGRSGGTARRDRPDRARNDTRGPVARPALRVPENAGGPLHLAERRLARGPTTTHNSGPAPPGGSITAAAWTNRDPVSSRLARTPARRRTAGAARSALPSNGRSRIGRRSGSTRSRSPPSPDPESGANPILTRSRRGEAARRPSGSPSGTSDERGERPPEGSSGSPLSRAREDRAAAPPCRGGCRRPSAR